MSEKTYYAVEWSHGLKQVMLTKKEAFEIASEILRESTENTPVTIIKYKK